MTTSTPESISDRPPIVIEGGHLYAPSDTLLASRGQDFTAGEPINPELHIGFELAKTLEQQLLTENFAVQQVFLYDDVDPRLRQASSKDSWRWELFIQRTVQQGKAKAGPEATSWSEYDFMGPALAIVDELRMRTHQYPEGYRLTEDGRSLVIGTGKTRRKVKLLGYRDHAELASCEVLDMAVYRAKLSAAGFAITILPEGFELQQERVKSLFAVLGEDPNIATIFYNDAGELTRIDFWNDETEATLAPILTKALTLDEK